MCALPFAFVMLLSAEENFKNVTYKYQQRRQSKSTNILLYVSLYLAATDVNVKTPEPLYLNTYSTYIAETKVQQKNIMQSLCCLVVRHCCVMGLRVIVLLTQVVL